jgi:protein-tyrosine phosphatase
MQIRPITKENPYRINFVCMGNICRSPTAEGVFQHLVKQAKLDAFFEIDSSGTGAWHVGEPANSKSRAVADEYGVQLLSRARQFSRSDLDYFDLVVPMDDDNFEHIVAAASNPEQRAKVVRLRNWDPSPDDGQVPDPYYGGLQGFHDVFNIVDRSCRNLLSELIEKGALPASSGG